jgi:hypothetical protein
VRETLDGKVFYINNIKKLEEKNVLDRVKNLICYDVPTCCFTIFAVFFIVWASIGLSWNS